MRLSGARTNPQRAPVPCTGARLRYAPQQTTGGSSLVRSAARSRTVWLFNSLDFSGNPKWLFLYVLARRPDIEAYWIADTEDKATFVRELGYPATTYADKRTQERAGVYVVNQVKERVPEELLGTVILNLWHGVGVKLVERQMKTSELLPRIAEKYIRNNRTYRDSMMFLVTSPLMEQHFQKQIAPLPHQVIRADYPQNSVRRVLPDIATFDHDIRGRKGLAPDARIVVWAPTYRLNGNDTFTQRALPDMERVLDVLEETNQLLVMKMHPRLLNDASFRRVAELYSDHPRILVWDNREDFYEVFGQVDTAIVDYSSIHYDLIAAGVQRFIRYAFDLTEPGSLEPGMDYESMSVGTLARDFDELLEALTSDNLVPASDLQRIDDLFWAYRENADLDHIVDAALSYSSVETPLPELYSFDVFDTVIHRRGVLPRSIFLAMRDRLLLEGAQWPAYFAHRFEEIRAQAEHSSREAKRKDPRRQARKDFEISLDEIYETIAHVYPISTEQAMQLKEWEIELELQDVVSNPAMVERVVALRDAGEKVVFVSDMYLPLPVIEAMIERADSRLAGVPVYLSSAYGVQKSTSALYAQVFADVDYDFERWIHVGDNSHADIEMAKRVGITVDPVSPTKLDELEAQFLDQAGTHDAALIAGLFRRQRIEGGSRTDLFAYRHVAGLLVPYVIWAVDDAIKRGYETLYFVARDGHFLKIIADAYIEETSANLKTRYIYGSRRSWRLASQVDNLAADTFAPHGLFGGVRNLDAVAKQAHMATSELLTAVPELRAWVDRRGWNGEQRGEVLNILRGSRDFQDHLLAHAKRDNVLAQKYMRQEIDFNEKFALVDYWGRGYTQDCLVDIFRSMGDVDSTVPFYYARSIYRSEGDSVRYNYTSAAYRLTLVELILANQPHGTTLAYEDSDDGTVRAVFEPREYDADLLDATERMIDRFTRDVVALPLADRSGALHEVFRFSFDHFSTHQTHPDYVEFLAPLRDSVTMGDKEREFAPSLTLREYLRVLRTLRPGEVTRSLPLSLKRSALPVRVAAKLQEKIGFRRWVVKAKSRVSR